jgi:hypothetical protein
MHEKWPTTVIVEEDRRALLLVADVLVEIRRLAQRGASHATIEALAGSVHNTPRLIAAGATSMRWLIETEQARAAGLLAGTEN